MLEADYLKDFMAEWFIGIAGFKLLEYRMWGRDHGHPARIFYPARMLEEYLKHLEEDLALRKPAYQSVNYFTGVHPKPGTVIALEKIFLDLDYPRNIDVACREAAKLLDHLSSYCRPLVVFSGLKGYHLYVFLPRPIEGSKVFLKKLLMSLLGELGITGLSLRSLDERSAVDVSRLSRIPYTIHDKSGRTVFPVDENMKPISPESFDLREYFSNPVPEKIVEKVLMGLRELCRGEYSWIKLVEKPSLLKKILRGVSGFERLTALRALAEYYKYFERASYRECLNKISLWNRKNVPPLPAEEVEKIVSEIYLEERDR